MNLIAIQTDSMAQGEFVFGAIDDAIAYDRAKLDDLVLVGPAEKGIEIRHRKGWFGRMFGSGIDDGTAKRLQSRGPAEGAVVLALGDQAEAVARRARTITGTDLKTYAVDGDTLTELTGADATYALEDETGALLEEPGVTGGDDDLPRGRLSRP
jgi:hypothetical protein